MTKNDNNIPHLSLSAHIPRKTKITNISLISARKQALKTTEQFSNVVLSGKTVINGLQLEHMMELMSLEEVSTL